MKLPLNLLLAGTVFLSSCANMSDGDVTRAQGAGAGALLGAGLGALIGAATGADDEQIAQNAVLGAGLGLLAGGAYGNHIANKKAAYKSEEQWLDASIANARRLNLQAKNENASLQRQIAQIRKEISIAKAARDKRKLAALNSKVRTLRSSTAKRIKTYDKEVAAYKSIPSKLSKSHSSRLSNLHSETTAVAASRNTASSLNNQLASLQSQTDV